MKQWMEFEKGVVGACIYLVFSHISLLLFFFFFFSSRRRHTRFDCDLSSDVCSSDLAPHHDVRAHTRSRILVRERTSFETCVARPPRVFDLRSHLAQTGCPDWHAREIGRASCRERV